MAIYHTQPEARVYELIIPVLKFMGYDIVRIRFKQGIRVTLQIMIERLDQQPVVLADCETVSKQLSVTLDVTEIIDSRYNLEVSSPGVERPLTREQDFFAYMGEIVKITTFMSLGVGKRLTGTLLQLEDGVLTIQPVDTTTPVNIKLENIREAILQPFAKKK